MLDTFIEQLIQSEANRQREGLELIASENIVHPDVMEAMGSVYTNKYAEGYPGRRYYGGCQYIDEMENYCIAHACALFKCEYANVQPHSGSQANMAVLMSLLEPGEKFIGFSLEAGGHLTHGSPVNFSGKLYNALSYGVTPDGLVDYDELARKVITERPKVIFGGGSAYSREWDYAKMRQIADTVGATLVIDMAHPAGLIAAGLLNNPGEHAHILTTTTHKTLRGPRGGMILIPVDFPNPRGIKDAKGNIKMMSAVIDSTIFPGIQGGPLEHVIAAKAVALSLCGTQDFKTYAENTIDNAKLLANNLIERGYKIVSGGTDNHCMLIDLRQKFPDMSGKEAEAVLQSVHITVNKNMVPGDTRSPFKTSGIRIGTPAITTRGFAGPIDMNTVAEFIDTALTNAHNPEVLESLKQKVTDFAMTKPLFNS